MRDYQKPSQQNSAATTSLSWLAIIGALLLCLVASAGYFYRQFNQSQTAVLAPQDLTARADEHLDLDLPSYVEYEFYSILEAEEPIRLERHETPPVGPSQSYYLRIAGSYRSYSEARALARQLLNSGIEDKISITPRSNGQQLAFILLVGPFSSRSTMFAQRDILYREQLDSAVLVQNN